MCNNGGQQITQTATRQQQIQTQTQAQTQTQTEKDLMSYYYEPVQETSAALTQQLLQGPPSHIKKKADRIRWQNTLQDQIAEARAKEEAHRKAQRIFMNVSGALVEDMSERIEMMGQERTVGGITSAFTECMKRVPELDPSKIVKEAPPEEMQRITVLSDILTKLRGMHAADLSPEAAAEMVKAYKGLNLAIQPAAASQLDTAVADPMACHLLLIHCTATSLSEIANKKSRDQIEEAQFAMLCGLASSSAVAVGVMYRSEDYRRRAIRREGGETPTRQEVEAVKESNISALQTGIGVGGVIPEEWPLREYADLAEELLGDEIRSMSKEELFYRAERMNEVLETNLPAIRLLVSARRDLTYSIPSLEEALLKKAARQLGTRLLAERLSDEETLLKQKIEEAAQDMDVEFGRVKTRLDQAAKHPGLARVLPMLPAAKLAEFVDQGDDEAFAERLKDQAEQVEKNLKTAEEEIAKKVSPLNRSRALDSLIAMDPGVMMNGAPAVVILVTEHFLQYINQYSPGTAERETNLKKVLKMAELTPDMAGPVCARIRRGNYRTLEEMAEAVKTIPVDVERNQEDFNEAVRSRKLSGAQWRMLHDWKDNHLDLTEQEGFKAMLEKLLKTDTYKAPDQGIEVDQYMRDRQAEKIQMRVAPKQQYLEQIKGEALCRWGGFENTFDGMEDIIESVLDEVLRHGVEIEGFEHIHRIDELGNVTHTAFQNFARKMRGRLLNCTDQWKAARLVSGFSGKTMREVLRDVLIGTITPENLLDQANAYIERNKRIKTTNPMRFQALLGGADDENIQLSYRYTDTVARRTLKKDSRPEARLVRFKNARIVWNEVRKAGNEAKLIDLCKPGTKSTEIKDKLKLLLPTDSEAYRLIQEKKDFNPVYELRIMGMESLLLASGKEAESFTSDKNEDYVKTLKAIGRWYHPRIEKLETVIQTLFTKPEQAAEAQKMRLRMTRIAAMLEPHGPGVVTEEMKERNRERCGVSDWEEALTEFEALMKEERTSENWKAIGEKAEQKKQMVDRLLKRHNGMYANLAYRIVETPEAWQAAVSGNATQIDDYLDWLDQRIQVPMKVLRQFNQPYLEAQILMQEEPIGAGMVADQILKGTIRTEGGWSRIYKKCYIAITEYAYNAKTVGDTFSKLTEKDRVLGPYLNAIVTRMDKGILTLADETQLKQHLDIFRQQITENTGLLEAYFTKNQTDEARRKALRQYLADRILESSQQDFEKDLESWIQVYDQAAVENVKQDRRAARTFARRQAEMNRVHERKQNRQASDMADTEALHTLRTNLYTTASPLFSAMGGTAVPDAARVEQMRGTLSRYYQDLNLPQAVLDCLLEKTLTLEKTPTMAELEVETTWLTVTYKQILTTKFNGDMHIGGNLAQELLTFLYIRHKDTINLVPLEDELRDTLKQLMDRYDKVDLISQFTSEDPVIQMECTDLAECMRFAVHTMGEDQFQGLLERRMKYLRNASAASKCFGALLEPYHLDGGMRLRVLRGLLEYYRFELADDTQELNLDKLVKRAEHRLQSEETRLYLADSTSMLGEVAYDDLTEKELAQRGVEDRKSLETAITASNNEEIVRAYEVLNVEQRQLFALALENPAFIREETLLPSARLAVNNLTAGAQMQQARVAVQAFIESDTFEPKVNYARALNRLMGIDGVFNTEAFQNALGFVLACTRARFAAIPTEWERLADSDEVIQAASHCAKENETCRHARAPKPVDDVAQLVRHLSHTLEDEDDAEYEKEVLNRFNGLDDMQMRLTILALQNRTMLDPNTIPGMGGYANEELRDDFMDRCVNDQQSILAVPMSQDVLTQALKALHSFRVRNDVDLRGRSLRREDFVESSISRHFVIDWGLLNRAMQLADLVLQSRLRQNAFRMAPQVIEQSGNNKAIAEYRKQQDHMKRENRAHTADEFEAYLRTQAEADGKMAILAGYLSLSDRDKRLFVKALGKREILDISKKGIMANRWGQGERDYADPEGRYELLDEYLVNARGQGGGVVLDEDAYSRAITSTLSTQMRDDVDFTTQKQLEDALTNKGLFKSTRVTAVDWKLVSRALQLVHRATNERDIFVEDRELYVSQHDLSRTGRFTFDSGYMRQNIHNAGNRFTRFFGRRVRSTAEDFLKTPSKYMKVPLMNPIDMEGEWHDKASDALGLLSDFYKESYGKVIVESLTNSELADTLEEYIGDVGDYAGYANDTVHILKDIHGHVQLARAKSKANAEKEGDAKRLQEAAKKQTADEAALAQKADERNWEMQKQGKSKAHERKNDDLVQSVSSIVGSVVSDAVGDESGLIKKACEEAGEFINFVRNYVNDVSSVRKYYLKRGEVQALRGVLPQPAPVQQIPAQSAQTVAPAQQTPAQATQISVQTQQPPTQTTQDAVQTGQTPVQKDSLAKMSDIELICEARGFENYTEMATFVGLNITRSLLFCAGPYNPQKRLRIMAIATLTAIGMKDAIGLQDSETGQKVYEALMGGDYR